MTVLRGALPLLPDVEADAAISPCGTYRYALTRDWQPKGRGHVLWVMLNPSIADVDVDDRTIRKCQKFAQRWGYDGITVANLFALRATTPTDLYAHPSPVGPANDEVLAGLLAGPSVGMVVAAWGVHGDFRGRDLQVIALAEQAGRELHALRLTKQGHPWHPLYIPDDTSPFLWTPRR